MSDNSQQPNYIKINNFKRFEKIGDSLEGVFMGIQHQLGTKEDGKPFLPIGAIFEQGIGVTRFVVGAQLSKLLPIIPIGVNIKLVYSEDSKGNVGTMKCFDVFVEEGSVGKLSTTPTTQLITADPETGEIFD